eukprot:2779532-Prymnesium_polylepis.1
MWGQPVVGAQGAAGQQEGRQAREQREGGEGRQQRRREEGWTACRGFAGVSAGVWVGKRKLVPPPWECERSKSL